MDDEEQSYRMDDLSIWTEQDAGQPEAPDSQRGTANSLSENHTEAGSAQTVSRPITSKRIVLSPNAKRIGKIVPPPVAPVSAPVQPVEPSPVIDEGETAPETTSFVENPVNAAPSWFATNGEEAPTPIEVANAVANEPLEASAPDKSSQASIEPASVTTEARAFELKPGLRPSSSEVPSAPTSSPRAAMGRVNPGVLPYAPATALPAIPTTVDKKGSRRGLNFVLWGTGILLLAAAVVAALFALNLVPGTAAPQVVETPTQVALASPTKLAPSPTTTLLPTEAPTQVPPVPTGAPLIIPTPPLDGQQKSFLPDSSLTGWFTPGDSAPHYGDDNLNVGTFQGQNLSSMIQFRLDNLPTDTKILFAALELTGREQDRLGADGTWQLELVQNSLDTDWDNATSQQLADAPAIATIGTPVPASELGNGRLNRWILSDTERQLLEQQFKNGNAVFRLRGPDGTSDNLFTWEGGSSGSTLNAPTLHLVYVPGSYVIVTNTPEPTNVLTAAAYVVRGTDQAKRLGTPTPFPPGVATATPGGGIIVVDSSTAIPQNQETAFARAALATAVARTTGTFTPIPQTVVIQYPTFTPVVIDPSDLATATPIPPDADLVNIPIDYDKCQCQGRIFAVSNRFGDQKLAPIMLEPDGTIIGKLSGDLYYKLAVAREPYSPDRTKRLIYPPNSNGVQQVGYEDLGTGAITYLTNFPKGIAYDAAWSPDGSAVAYVSTERGNTDEIWVYDFGTQQNTRITDASQLGQPWSKHPTWSPDGQQIAFWSSRSGHPQIWVMNRDGTEMHNISNNAFDERDPVWVK